LVALMLVAELMRNTGRFTMADVLSFRLNQRPVRMAAALATLAVCLFYLIAQMAGAGGLVALLLNINDSTGQAIVVAAVGILMIVYVLVGGMKGTTYVQMVKAVLLVGGVLIMCLFVLVAARGNFSALLGEAVANSGKDLLSPGLQYGATETSKLDFISLSIALVFGTAGLPHVLMRFYTVPTAKEARRSVTWAIALIGSFYLFTLVLGFGAAAMVGSDVIEAAPGGVNSAAPLLAFALGGEIFLGIISAVAFATILAVVAGLAITASASFAHDIYNGVIKHGKATEKAQLRVSRITVVVIGVASIIMGIGAMGQNIAFLVALAFAIAASANLPTILYSLFWKRFNTTGALFSMYGGLISTLVLIALSPAVSGGPKSMITSVDFSLFPLSNPGIVSIPLAFLLGIIGTFLGIISAVAFATILAVVAGLAITASASFAHDIYNGVIKHGKATEKAQLRVSRITVVVIGIASIIMGIGAMGQNIAFFVALAFAIAASANLPTILYSLFWKRFNTTGALFSMY
ncbi:MAG: hypothetical protein U1C73_20780, partial [Dietzia sp.]|nr:hypothetical protein [Dietzia sp.]